jgi:serine/threonine protein kinase
MPLHPTSQLLVDTLTALPLLAGRFANMACVSYDAAGRRGVCGLVFRAEDTVEGRPVALKFFDPALSMDRYRLDAFGRECDILQSLMNVDRCLQLEKALTPFSLPVPGSGIEIPCQYFATQWLEDDIDRFFLGKSNDAIDQLQLFNQMVLAVEALHRRRIFHRDLKVNNFRMTKHAAEGRRVIAIDLGTAARIDSSYIQTAYGPPVGASGYASPEAIAGLTANRTLAPLTDVYALGCLLFEMFNRDYFFRGLYAANPHLDARLTAMAQLVPEKKSEARQVEQWRTALAQFGGGVISVTIDGPGSSVPPAVVALLNDLLSRLTHVNYLNRPPLDWVRQRTWTAIRVLQNHKAAEARLKFAREFRRRRLEKVRARQARFDEARRAFLNEAMLSRKSIC